MKTRFLIQARRSPKSEVRGGPPSWKGFADHATRNLVAFEQVHVVISEPTNYANGEHALLRKYQEDLSVRTQISTLQKKVEFLGVGIIVRKERRQEVNVNV